VKTLSTTVLIISQAPAIKAAAHTAGIPMVPDVKLASCLACRIDEKVFINRSGLGHREIWRWDIKYLKSEGYGLYAVNRDF
jgi:hypothetical protein